jgi:hypothetical protein
MKGIQTNILISNAAHVVLWVAGMDKVMHAPISMGLHIGVESRIVETRLTIQQAEDLCKKMNQAIANEVQK